MRLRWIVALVLQALPLAAATAPAVDPFKALDLVVPERVQAAHVFTIPAPEGADVRLADYRGKVVFLNFWATWCVPCREEMPAMERLYRRFKERGFVVLAVSVDTEPAPAVRSFVQTHGYTYPVGLDPKMALARQYGVRALPSSFLVDKAGNLAARAVGSREWDSEAGHALVDLLLGQP